MTMRWMAALLVTASAALGAQAPAGIFGFTPSSADRERTIETRFLALPSADRAREYHRFLTEQPHLAGSDRNRELAGWMRDGMSPAFIIGGQLLPGGVDSNALAALIGIEKARGAAKTASAQDTH